MNASTGRMLRALMLLPVSDRVSKGFVGWAVAVPRRHWKWALPGLALGVGMFTMAQMIAFGLSLTFLGIAALFLGISNFGFYSDKKIALRYFEDVPQIVLSALFMYFKGGADASAIVNATASTVLMTIHVLRDLVGEFRRIAKVRRERAAGLMAGATEAPEGPTAEDLADALEGRRQVAHLMLGAPWCSALSAVLTSVGSLFVLPGAGAATAPPFVSAVASLCFSRPFAYFRSHSPFSLCLQCSWRARPSPAPGSTTLPRRPARSVAPHAARASPGGGPPRVSRQYRGLLAWRQSF